MPPPNTNAPAPRSTAAPFNGTGALAGKRIIVSPGHGYYSTGTSWTTQRGNGAAGLDPEDINTNAIAIDYLIPMLERAGARVFSARERSKLEEEAIRDNDNPTGFTTSGNWPASTSPGYNGGTYRYADGSAAAKATWEYKPIQQGMFPVWVWYRESGNRTTSALYKIEHSGGTSEVRVDQTKDGQRWVFIGEYPVSSGATIKVSLEHGPGGSGVAIADAVRFGAGMGSINRGHGVSGQPRWKECARYWLQTLGAPSTVYDGSTTDRIDDIASRGYYADWQGGDAFLSVHTNAGGGTGTETFMQDPNVVGPSAGSEALRNAVNAKLVAAIRGLYDPAWTNRGVKVQDIGELRVTRTMPATLTELAFHDKASPDAAFIARQDWRHDVARGLVRGLIAYLNPQGIMAPLAPGRPNVAAIGSGQVQLSWLPTADPLDANAAASRYYVAYSTDGFAFNIGVDVGSGTSTTLSGFTPGSTISFRVIAANAGGESLPSPAAAVTIQ